MWTRARCRRGACGRPTATRWLGFWAGSTAQLIAAVEAMTGWRFVVEELQRVGAEVHLAEPAETSARRGPERRAKTDRLDARLLRELLVERRLPEAWIPPAHILDLCVLRWQSEEVQAGAAVTRGNCSEAFIGAPWQRVGMAVAQVGPARRAGDVGRAAGNPGGGRSGVAGRVQVWRSR